MNPKRIVMTALPGRNWVTTGMKCFMNSFREAASTRASTRPRTPTPYTSAPIQAMPNQMWRNRRINAMASATRRHRPILLKSFADAGRSLISRERIRGSMSDLVEAIEAEARGDFSQALTHYEKLTVSGSAIDRVGILQALARCNEKLGRLRDERQYLALVEYRNAVQDLHGDPSLKEVAKEYAAVLKDNFSGGAEGLTHEGLFAGAFFRALGDHLTAAKYFFDTAEVMSEQASTSGDAELREATILVYERAMDSATKAGRADVARVAQMRAYDLRQTK